MSIEISSEEKTLTVVKRERTWRTEIFTENGQEDLLKIWRELETQQDNVVTATDREGVALKSLSITMPDIVGDDTVISYEDKDGKQKEVKLSDLPFIIPACIEYLVATKKETIEAKRLADIAEREAEKPP